ncbi:MAG: hypothetical protein KAG14_02980, partial [Mycoplasmataceae bacterium]|nr:hypothetical protein [Mycoplasmataceae bacterium]
GKQVISVVKVDVSHLKYEILVHNKGLQEIGDYIGLDLFWGSTHKLIFDKNTVIGSATHSSDVSRLHLEFRVISNRDVVDPTNIHASLYHKGTIYSFASYADLSGTW